MITYLIPTQKPHSFKLPNVVRTPLPSKPLLRSLPLAKQCQYFGSQLTLAEVNEKKLAGCRQCNGEIAAYHCTFPGQKKFNDGPYTRGAECMSCTDWSLENSKPTTESTADISTHQPDPASLPRHLLFHIWPRKISQGTWQRNLDQLKQRWSLFDGKRVIAVATSIDSHSFEAVQSYMVGYECEWIHIENNPTLREVATFAPLFERVEGLDGYTFYAQGKGVTKPINEGVSIHNWTSAMYEVNLDYWPLVQEQLQKYPVTGAFKKSIHGAFGNSRSQWHYSGSFCWFNNRELWNRNWRDIEQVWFGIESYPSMIYSDSEAGCLFFSRNRQFDLYSQKYWEIIVEKELEQWRRENVGKRSVTGAKA